MLGLEAAGIGDAPPAERQRPAAEPGARPRGAGAARSSRSGRTPPDAESRPASPGRRASPSRSRPPRRGRGRGPRRDAAPRRGARRRRRASGRSTRRRQRSSALERSRGRPRRARRASRARAAAPSRRGRAGRGRARAARAASAGASARQFSSGAAEPVHEDERRARRPPTSVADAGVPRPLELALLEAAARSTGVCDSVAMRAYSSRDECFCRAGRVMPANTTTRVRPSPSALAPAGFFVPGEGAEWRITSRPKSCRRSWGSTGRR